MYKDRSRSTHSDCSLVSSLHVVKVAQMYIFRPLKISKSTCSMVQIRSLKSTHLGCSIVNTGIKNQVAQRNKLRLQVNEMYTFRPLCTTYKVRLLNGTDQVAQRHIVQSGRSKLKSSSFYSICSFM